MADTPLQDLNVGDIIYAPVLIDRADLVDPNSQSTTTKDTIRGLRVRRIALVLGKSEKNDAILVTHFATFGEKTKLPQEFKDKRDFWFPIVPAQDEGVYPPLELNWPAGQNGPAQWASLRQKQLIDVNVLNQELARRNQPRPADGIYKMTKLVQTAPPKTVAGILEKMKS